MTSDTELRDLLTSEAAGPSTGAGWDDVVRRGRRRQRVRRARVGALAALVAGGVVSGIALSTDDPILETTPPATDPTVTTERDGSTTTSVPMVPDGDLQAGRVQGAFLTVIIPAADPTIGFDPCADLHPRTAESADQIGIELVGDEVQRGRPWAACQSSPFSGWGTIELIEPYTGQPVIDLTTGDRVDVIDGAPLLFPTTLPEPFDIQRWDEFSLGDEWTFSWTADDRFVNVTNDYGIFPEGCDLRTVELRGTEARLCEAGSALTLHWDEGGRTIMVELGALDSEEPTGFTVDQVLAIAEGLEPLGG
jgi:hypothetical protein